jgi:hypothetical protein
MFSETFEILFLIGRPAAGKSEIISFLKSLPAEERSTTCHIGDFREIDDFPMIWIWFEEDGILTKNGKPRLYTDHNGYFKFNYLWNLLIERLEKEYLKIEASSLTDGTTVVIEFARGKQHGGFIEAFSHFSDKLLRRAAVLYIDVSFEESLRKNRKRFNPDKPYSILEHALPDEKLKRLYGESDWHELCSADPDYLHLKGTKVPYKVFENMDDITTKGGEALAGRLRRCLAELWEKYSR